MLQECSICCCRLPELKDRDHSSSSQHHMQPLHPQASEAQLPQQVQGQQLAEKLQHKLQGDSTGSRAVATAPADPAAAPADSETALAADSQLQMDTQTDRRHHKMAHAHFAEDVDDDSITGRNESITAVRGGEASSSQAEGTFWKRLDANGSFTSDPGAALIVSIICKMCSSIHTGVQTTMQFAKDAAAFQQACIAPAIGLVSVLYHTACHQLQTFNFCTWHRLRLLTTYSRFTLCRLVFKLLSTQQVQQAQLSIFFV